MRKAIFTKSLKIALCLSIFVFSQSTFALIALRSWDTGKTIDFNDGLDWPDTNNNVSLSIEFCVISRIGNNTTGTPTNYAIKVGTVNPYSISRGTLPDLPISIEYSEKPSLGFETLTPNVYTSQTHLGKIRCNAGVDPDNAILRLSIQNADLVAAAFGTYTRVFVVTVIGGTGAETRSANLTVRLIIQPLMKITQINDIIFSSWDQINPLIGSDTFCVFRNGAGDYTVNARGSGAGFAFTLNSGASLLPYTLTWNGVAMTANVTSGPKTGAWTVGTTCNGGANNNVTLALTISAPALAAATQAIYTGTVTLILSPL